MPNRPPLPPAPAPFDSLITDWDRAMEAEGLSKSTRRMYRDVATKFHLWCVSPIAPPDAEDPALWLAAVPEAPDEPEDIVAMHVRSWVACRIAETSKGNGNNT